MVPAADGSSVTFTLSDGTQFVVPMAAPVIKATTSKPIGAVIKITFAATDTPQAEGATVSSSSVLGDYMTVSYTLTSNQLALKGKITMLSISSAGLTALDLTGNPNLESLVCEWNSLTTLDVSKNTKLTNLMCSNNQLTALDLSKNTALSILYCSNNQLTALDLSQNTALGELDCVNNKLTVLKMAPTMPLLSMHCFLNLLTGTAVDDLIASLPSASSNMNLYFKGMSSDGNKMTPAQMAAATAKRWIPQLVDESTYANAPYAGE